MSELMSCYFDCGKPLDPRDPLVCRGVHGWEIMGRQKGREGGGSDITLREPIPDEYAHYGCVKLAKMGVSPAQQALV